MALNLYKGNLMVAGRSSPNSLYRTDMASFTMGEGYRQKDAEGFIRILGLPARSMALLKKEKERDQEKEGAELQAPLRH